MKKNRGLKWKFGLLQSALDTRHINALVVTLRDLRDIERSISLSGGYVKD